MMILKLDDTQQKLELYW